MIAAAVVLVRLRDAMMGDGVIGEQVMVERLYASCGCCVMAIFILFTVLRVRW